MSKVEDAESFIPADEDRAVRPNFITEVIDRDLQLGRHRQVVTRFPPEPNGYLHIGHAKAICLNFGVADDYGGITNLRFDDTNPETEDMAYVEAQREDIRWLGFTWENLLFASDYFEQLYQLALRLIEKGLAYVDSLSEEEIRAYRGTVTEPGRESPYRERPVGENLELFRRMRAGDFPPGSHVLRARIDMAAANMIMRDPILYRIAAGHHYRTGDAWPIYPLYDFAHPLSDAIEGITHSLCSLEFENNRAIYDWLTEHLFEPPRPHQYEFARLFLDYTVVSKRKLITLVREGYVDGWDDPRMPTLAALRRRGITPEAIRAFINQVGVSKANSRTDIALLEHAIRDDLNARAPRTMAVVDPLKVTLTSYPEGRGETLDAPYWPHDVPREGSRPLPFGRTLYIERSDFAEVPPKGWRRLSPGAEVRLRHAYVIRCDEVVKDESGQVVELRCSHDPDTLGRNPAGRRVGGTIHWLAADHALEAEFRLYDRLFTEADPEASDRPFTDFVNPESRQIRRGFVEPSVAADPADTRYQFERQGYFWRDPVDSSPEAPVFNRIVPLKDTWGRKNASAAQEAQRPTGPAKTGDDTPPPGTEPAPDPLAGLDAGQRRTARGYVAELGLSEADAALIAGDQVLSGFFEQAAAGHANPTAIANWVVNDLQRERKERSMAEPPFGPGALAGLVTLIDDGVINARIAKDVFAEMAASGRAPEAIVEERGLRQLTDAAAIEPVVARLLADHPEQVAAYRGGKTGLLGFFVGQAMRATGGRANPQLVRELLEAKLQEGD